MTREFGGNGSASKAVLIATNYLSSQVDRQEDIDRQSVFSAKKKIYHTFLKNI